MTRSHTYERSHRCAPRQNFGGGYHYNARILPMERPGLFARIFRGERG